LQVSAENSQLEQQEHQQFDEMKVKLTKSLDEVEEENSNHEMSTLLYVDSSMASPKAANEVKEDSTLWSRHPDTLSSSKDDPKQLSSILLLNLVAVIWGSQHAVIKMIVADSDVAAFTLWRFTLAALFALPYLPGLPHDLAAVFHPGNDKINAAGDNKSLASADNSMSTPSEVQTAWRWGIEMGLWMFLGFSLQAIGLLSTTAQRSGFLLYLNVKFVPFFAYLLLGRQISKWTWLSAVTAFSGTALLALDGQSSIGLNVGDIWSVLAAMASAMYILRLEEAALQVPKVAALNASSLFVVASLSGLWVLLGQVFSHYYLGSADSMTWTMGEKLLDTIQAHPFELLYLGAVSTALSNFLQAKAQKHIPAERASIIYSLDPVYGAMFSFVLLGETLGGPQSYVGAAMIFAAAATNSLLEFAKVEK
jgi:drug/metabolite transporter (DMT)-like permease